MNHQHEALQDTKDNSDQVGSLHNKVSDSMEHIKRKADEKTNHDPTQQMGERDAHHYILQNLDSLCEHYSHDIHFTYVPSSSSGIDISGSFLRTDENENLDFFDTNEKGEIILQPPPPIFPEEFPTGMKEHSLQWWGVVDPAVGDGRFKVISTHLVPDPIESHRGLNPNDPRDQQLSIKNYDRKYNHPHHHPRDLHHHDNYGPPQPPGGPPPSYGRPRRPDRRRDRR